MVLVLEKTRKKLPKNKREASTRLQHMFLIHHIDLSIGKIQYDITEIFLVLESSRNLGGLPREPISFVCCDLISTLKISIVTMPGRRDSKASSIPSSRGSVSSEDNFHRRVSWVSEGSDMQIDHIEALNDLGGDEELDDLTKATTSVSRGSRGSRGSGRGSRGSARSSLMGSIFGSKKGKKGRRGSGRSSLSSRSSQNISSFWSE